MRAKIDETLGSNAGLSDGCSKAPNCACYDKQGRKLSKCIDRLMNTMAPKWIDRLHENKLAAEALKQCLGHLEFIDQCHGAAFLDPKSVKESIVDVRAALVALNGGVDRSNAEVTGA